MLKILVVDDDEQVRRLASAYLSAAGHEVRQASHGKEALSVLDEWPPDLLLTDIVMPEMEGLQLIRLVRRLHPAVRIIAMSGGAVENAGLYLKTAGRFGADAMLNKPFRLADLLRAVAEACKQSSEPKQ